MLIAPEGRFIPVNMDRCQDLMGGLFEHITPAQGIGYFVVGPLEVSHGHVVSSQGRNPLVA